MNPIPLITRIILTFVLPVLTTAIVAMCIALVIAFVASTTGYDFQTQYQTVIKDGFVFVIPGMISIIGTIIYWMDFVEE